MELKDSLKLHFKHVGLLLVRFNHFIDLTCCCSYKWEAIDKDNNVTYTLKLCESSPPTDCGPGAAVCAQNTNTKAFQSVGEYRKT